MYTLIISYQEQIVNKKQQKGGGFLSKDLQRWSKSGGFW